MQQKANIKNAKDTSSCAKLFLKLIESISVIVLFFINPTQNDQHVHQSKTREFSIFLN